MAKMSSSAYRIEIGMNDGQRGKEGSPAVVRFSDVRDRALEELIQVAISFSALSYRENYEDNVFLIH